MLSTVSIQTSTPALSLPSTNPTIASAPIAATATDAPPTPAINQSCGQWIREKHNSVINTISDKLSIASLKTMAVNSTDSSFVTAAKIATSVLAFFYIGVTVFFGLYELGKKVTTWLCGANPAPGTLGAGGAAGVNAGTNTTAATTVSEEQNLGASSSASTLTSTAADVISGTGSVFSGTGFDHQSTLSSRLHSNQPKSSRNENDKVKVFETRIQTLETQLETVLKMKEDLQATVDSLEEENTQLGQTNTQLRTLLATPTQTSVIVETTERKQPSQRSS